MAFLQISHSKNGLIAWGRQISESWLTIVNLAGLSVKRLPVLHASYLSMGNLDTFQEPVRLGYSVSKAYSLASDDNSSLYDYALCNVFMRSS